MVTWKRETWKALSIHSLESQCATIVRHQKKHGDKVQHSRDFQNSICEADETTVIVATNGTSINIAK